MKRILSVITLMVLGVLALTAGVRDDFKANPKLSANNYQAYPVGGFPAITARQSDSPHEEPQVQKRAPI
jgi:hypothetical protein